MKKIFKHARTSAAALLLLSTGSIAAQCNLNASFNLTQGSNGQVTLVSTSTGTISSSALYWNMGNGQLLYGSPLTYAYPASGNYNIRLLASNGTNCIDTSAAQPVSVNLGTCVANPNYTLVPSGTPQVWNAIVANPSSVAAALWSWGDGATSNTLLTSHQYAAPGNYMICLSLTLTCGHSASNCDTTMVYRNSANMVSVNVVDANTSVGLKEQSNGATDFIVSPNPSNGLYNLNISGIAAPIAGLEVRDITGRMIHTSIVETSSATNVPLDLRAQPAGIYFVRMYSAQGSSCRKIVLQK